MAKLLPGLRQYHRPDTIDDAMNLIRMHGQNALILAGGTSISFHKPKVDVVIDISGLPYTDCRIDNNGNLEIGSLTTIHSMEKNPIIQEYCQGIMIQATDALANTPLRNLITIGGNICGGFPWSDLPVTCLALDAVLETYDGTSFSRLDTSNRLDRSIFFKQGLLLTRIILPVQRQNAGGRFFKFMKTAVGFGLVTVAVSYNLNENFMQNVRVVCGCIVNAPIRLSSVEQALENTLPDSSIINKVAESAANELSIKPDTVVDEKYRRNILAALIERAITESLED
jgi:aerobic carbon-monoxide dehydrogenase medium subunit